MIKESDIERSILAYLEIKQIFSWKAKTVGTFDPVKMKFRKNYGYMKGVSDILGIFNGFPLAIEVKKPKGYPSPEQKIFLERFKEAGGISFIARSIEDVEENLIKAMEEKQIR